MAYIVTKRTENKSKVVISVKSNGHEDQKLLVDATTLENATGTSKLSIDYIHYFIDLKPEGLELLRNEDEGFNFQYLKDLGWIAVEHDLNKNILAEENQAIRALQVLGFNTDATLEENTIAITAVVKTENDTAARNLLLDAAYNFLSRAGYTREDARKFIEIYRTRTNAINQRTAQQFPAEAYTRGQFSGGTPNPTYASKTTNSDTLHKVCVWGKGKYGGIPKLEIPVFPFNSNSSGKILISCGYLVNSYSLSIECNKYTGFN